MDIMSKSDPQVLLYE